MYPKDEDELLEFAFFNEPETLKALKEEGVYIYKNETEKEYEKYKSGKLRVDNKPGFPTATGKVEFDSTILKTYGYEPLPKFVVGEETLESESGIKEEFPLVLNTGARIQTTFRTQHLNIDGLLDHQDRPYIYMNEDDAKDRGIEDGDRVLVKTKRGEIEVFAKTNREILKGDTELNFGGGSPIQGEFWRRANTNSLTDNSNCDEVTGFPVFKQLLCEIKKI